MKITTSNKGSLQLAFMNPYLVDKEQSTRFAGLLKTDIEDVKQGLQAAYGDNWFALFIALRPVALNTKLNIK